MPRCVVCLHQPVLTFSPHHFLNHGLGHSFISQTLMHSQEIDLTHLVDILATEHHFLGASDDTGQDLAILRIPNHKV